MKRNHQFVIDQQIWSTELSDHDAFGVWLSGFRRGRGGDSGLQELIEAELGKVQGFPLKAVTVTTMSGGRGRNAQAPSTSRMEVTALREEPIAAGTWTLDSSLTETPMMMLPGMGAAGDGEEESGGLRGLLKRRRGGGG